MNYSTLSLLRDRHPAWRLLASPHAALLASFMNRVFVLPNVRVMDEADLAEALEDELFALREQLGAEAYPKAALDYLNDWCAADKGWLRKFYRPGTDEAQYDLTPATEKAIAWLASLTERLFVGTESRLLMLFALLDQISAGTEADPAKRLEDLRAKRDALDAEIRRVLAGDLALLDDTAVRDRFQQFQQLARELLSDFREVEHNFRMLDRKVREKIALWEGSKGALLDEIMGERDAIGDSDQGRSFRAFWDFLMSSSRQEQLTERLEQVLALPAVAALKPEPRTRRVHHDWLEAGEHTQRTVAQLSQQLRRFLDDRTFVENRRILDLLRAIEVKALVLRDAPPAPGLVAIDAMGAEIELPLERPLFTPTVKTRLAASIPEEGEEEVDTARLFNQIVVDKARLRAAIQGALRQQSQVSLRELVTRAPLRQGLAELVAYLELAHGGGADDGPGGLRAVVDENVEESIRWQASSASGEPVEREARLPRVIFTRGGSTQKEVSP
jgi:flagellar motility protein MotE (MotC chaperone)